MVDVVDANDIQKLNLVPTNDPILRVKIDLDPFNSDLVWSNDGEVVGHEEKMFNTMVHNYGIGLASPQVGDAVKFFAMRHSTKGHIGVYNPEILDVSEEQITMEEGCLSFPALFIHLTRPKIIKVKYQDSNKKEVVEELDEWDSRIFQHEYDHLDGRLFIEYASDFKLQRAIKKRDKLLKKFSQARK